MARKLSKSIDLASEMAELRARAEALSRLEALVPRSKELADKIAVAEREVTTRAAAAERAAANLRESRTKLKMVEDEVRALVVATGAHPSIAADVLGLAYRICAPRQAMATGDDDARDDDASDDDASDDDASDDDSSGSDDAGDDAGDNDDSRLGPARPGPGGWPTPLA